MQGVLTFAIALQRSRSPPGLQLPQWELTWEYESSSPHSLTLSPKARVATHDLTYHVIIDSPTMFSLSQIDITIISIFYVYMA
jgi:hypothetical protein